MPKSLELKILERPLKLAELELARLEASLTPMRKTGRRGQQWGRMPEGGEDIVSLEQFERAQEMLVNMLPVLTTSSDLVGDSHGLLATAFALSFFAQSEARN